MATLTADQQQLRALARFLVRERDRDQRLVAEYGDLSTIAARHQGKADAYGQALAYISGMVGLRTVEALELLVRGEAPAPADVDPTWSEAELRLAWGDR